MVRECSQPHRAALASMSLGRRVGSAFSMPCRQPHSAAMTEVHSCPQSKDKIEGGGRMTALVHRAAMTDDKHEVGGRMTSVRLWAAAARTTPPSLLLLLFLLSSLLLTSPLGQSDAQATGLVLNFYARSCPGAEAVVASRVKGAVKRDPGTAAKLLRLFFHDCFVNGCDASMLLDSIDGDPSEKDAEINDTVGGFEIIDDIKSKLESVCKKTVSCADILALAARDAVRQVGGPWIQMLTGRRDGSRGVAFDTESLPKLTSISDVLHSFHNQGLDTKDMVALSGAHTIGMAHCVNVRPRLPPFSPDGSMDSRFRKNVTRSCFRDKRFKSQNSLRLDPVSSNTFDNQYFQNLLDGRGLLITDSLLSSDRRTMALVQKWAGDKLSFFRQFNKSMLKMSAVGVLTGRRGEVRLNCHMPNVL